jgi:HEAT repeat protein
MNSAAELSDISALMRDLAGDDTRVARASADELRARAGRDAHVRDALQRAASVPGRERFAAAFALAGIEPFHKAALDAAPALLEALSDARSDFRWAAATLIARLGRARIDTIMFALVGIAQRGDPVARRMALYCIRDLEKPARESIHRAAAICACEAAILDADSHVRLAAIAAIAALSPNDLAAVAIIQKCADGDLDAGVRRAAASAIAKMARA